MGLVMSHTYNLSHAYFCKDPTSVDIGLQEEHSKQRDKIGMGMSHTLTI